MSLQRWWHQLIGHPLKTQFVCKGTLSITVNINVKNAVRNSMIKLTSNNSIFETLAHVFWGLKDLFKLLASPHGCLENWDQNF